MDAQTDFNLCCSHMPTCTLCWISVYYMVGNNIMCRSRKFCQRGSNSEVFLLLLFKLMRGERIQIPLKGGHHQPTREMPCKRHFPGGPKMAQYGIWLGSFVIFHGIWTSIAKKPYSFVIFHGWSGPPVSLLDRLMNILFYI